VMRDSLVTAFPFFVLIGLVLVSSIYQQKQIQGRNTGSQVNPQQQMIMKIMPYMLPVFSFTMPAALVVYFVISNVYRIGQQAYITHSLYSGDDSLGAQVAKQRKNDKAGSDGSSGSKSGGSVSTASKGPRQSGKKDLSAKRLKSEREAKESDGKQSSAKSAGKSTAKKQRGSGRAKPDSTKRSSKSTSKQGRGARQGGTTGKAPTRGRGGRTTEPGSPQHRKRKK